MGPAAIAQQSPGGSGLSISPTLSEYTLSPNQSTKLQLTLKDAALGPVIAKGEVDDFVSDGSTGNPKILTGPNEQSPNSIKKFVYDLNDVSLDRGEQKNVTVSIQIPEATPPGAYFGIIRYKAVPAGSTAPAPGQVALTASVGTVVLITVPGNLREQVQLSAIHVIRGSTDGSIFFGKPNKIGVEIKNFGNGFARPFGTVEVQNMFGKAVGSFQFNNPKQLGNVLPNSTRIFTDSFNQFNQIGRYKITANVSYGTGSQILTLTKTIWYIPVWLAIAVVILVLVLLYLAFRAYRRYNRDKRHS